MSLSELPVDCLAVILSWTTPIDVCKLACVSQAFAAAAESDITWHNLLPSDYRDIINGSPKALAAFRSLSEGLYLNCRTEKYKLLRRSGGVCRTLSAAVMGIAWGDDSRFWIWEHSRSSHFGKVAHLKAVCWLEVTGKWNISLPPDTYSVLWRLKVANPQGGQMNFLSWKRPLNFSLSTSTGAILEREFNLLQLPRNSFEQWFEFEVGHIEIKGTRGCVTQLAIEFSIRELDCSFWKGGLFLDCLTVRPITCIDPIYNNQSDRILDRVRGRPGVF